MRAVVEQKLRARRLYFETLRGELATAEEEGDDGWARRVEKQLLALGAEERFGLWRLPRWYEVVQRPQPD